MQTPTSTHKRMHICAYARTCVYVCVCTHSNIYTKRVHMCAYARTCVYVCVCTDYNIKHLRRARTSGMPSEGGGSRSGGRRDGDSRRHDFSDRFIPGSFVGDSACVVLQCYLLCACVFVGESVRVHTCTYSAYADTHTRCKIRMHINSPVPKVKLVSRLHRLPSGRQAFVRRRHRARSRFGHAQIILRFHLGF